MGGGLNSTLKKFRGCKMTEKSQVHLIKNRKGLLAQNIKDNEVSHG